MADRRAHTRAIDPAHAMEAASPVTDGLMHHLAADAWFHGSPVFTRGESVAREALRRAHGAPKLGLFAHVAWEMCLDGSLLRRRGAELVLRAIGDSIAAVRPEAHHRAARLHTGLAPSERPRFEARVDSILDAMARGPWVAGYATASGIVERLDGVRARLGLAAVTGPDRERVVEGFQALERQADAGLDEILSAGPMGHGGH
jgi:hypothetical protein